MQRPRTDDLAVTYQYWRKQYKNGWGLAWYLAAEINDRFYPSHAIRPEVIEHGGLGYYGIAIQKLACRVAQEGKTLGRITADGNVENWLTGSAGDHGLELIGRADHGDAPEALLRDAIRHLGLPILALSGHDRCRHKRWGASSVLVFRIAALMALRWNRQVEIWNCPSHVARVAALVDPKKDMSEHPGHLMITCREHELLFAGDGRILKPAGCESVWERYMSGESLVSLLGLMEVLLGLA